MVMMSRDGLKEKKFIPPSTRIRPGRPDADMAEADNGLPSLINNAALFSIMRYSLPEARVKYNVSRQIKSQHDRMEDCQC